MKRLKFNFKKGMALVLSLAMVVGLAPAMSGGATTVQAATGKEPSVTAFATKDQLMNDFKPDDSGTSSTIGKLIFGKQFDGTTAQEWYILGRDIGVAGENTIIFAASPIATGKKFNSSGNRKTYNYEAETGYGDTAGNIEVYANHYGANDLRVALQNMVDGSNTTYFTSAEQGLMNATTVTMKDTKNSMDYTTTDKLYALAADGHGTSYKTIKAGSDNNTVLDMSSFWNSGKWFWLRSPNGNDDDDALLAYPGYDVCSIDVRSDYDVQPASNLNLSSVLFASVATAASSSGAVLGTITTDKAMTLRLDGKDKNIGTVTYNTTAGDIQVTKGSTTSNVALVVQGNDGTDDWYYSKLITASETVNVSAIASESNTPASIDLSACKIWLEITDLTENLTYAVNATVSDISSVAITGIDTPVSNTALDTEASCTTEGVSSTTPQITWTPSDTTAGYNTSYTASITLTAATVYEFADTVTATVLGNDATSVMKNTDGTLTVTYVFPATAKDKLTSITAPQAIIVANGTAYTAMSLPTTVTITTEGNTFTSAPVSWDTAKPASGSYDPALLTEQTVTLNGTVDCPADLELNGILTTTTITITISAAGSGSNTPGSGGSGNTGGSGSDNPGGSGSGNTGGSGSGNPGGSGSDNPGDSGSDNPNTPDNAYQIMDGANSSWTYDSDGNITIRGNGDFSKFTGTKVDGNLIDRSNYTAREGSTIITLKASYLNTLSAGTHTVEILWADGSASTTFTIKEDTSGNGNNNQNDNDNNNSNPDDSALPDDSDKKDEVPKTGDDTPSVWLFMLVILSGAGLILTGEKGRKNLETLRK